MNSFNHYAFGAICEWMFGNAAGIQPIKAGFTEFEIRPEIDTRSGNGRINSLRASFHSIAGEIISGWKKKTGALSMSVEVPFNTTAKIYVPAKEGSIIHIKDKCAYSPSQKNLLDQKTGTVIFDVRSGTYMIEVLNLGLDF